MILKLVELLETQGLLISDICKNLDINTISTLKLISQVNHQDNQLIVNRNGKYYLSRKLDRLNDNIINQNLINANKNYSLYIFHQLGSTNSYALENSKSLPDKSIISCDWQNAGRGRFSRRWQSRIAHDLTLSVVYLLDKDVQIGLIPLITGIALNRLLKDHSIINKIKWPNDIYVNSSKIGGILVENISSAHNNYTVIGIGLDNFTNLPRNKLLSDLIIHLDNIFAEFKLFGFQLIRREWLDNCLHLNHQVIIQEQGKTVNSGTHVDIGDAGELIIANHSGRQIYTSSSMSLIIPSLNNLN